MNPSAGIASMFSDIQVMAPKSTCTGLHYSEGVSRSANLPKRVCSYFIFRWYILGVGHASISECVAQSSEFL